MRDTGVETNYQVTGQPIEVTLNAVSAAADAAFTTWYQGEYHQVVGLVYVLCGSRWAAEELTQDAFIEAHKRWNEIAGYKDPGAWVRRVAVNRTRSWGRRRGAEARAMAKHFGRRADLPNELPDSSETFWAAVRKLPERQSQIVALHYIDDQSVASIAEILDITEGTVKTQLHRGRKTLSATLGLEDPTTNEADPSIPTEEKAAQR